MVERSSALESRLEAIDGRLRQLVDLDQRCDTFGANRHLWAMEPSLDAEQIGAFERLHGVELPAEMRAFLEHVSASGAGPHYGLAPLPMTLLEETWREARAWKMQGAFVGDDDHEVVARDPSLRGGYLVLADQGCGYHSVLSRLHGFDTLHFECSDTDASMQAGTLFVHRAAYDQGTITRSVYCCRNDGRWTFAQHGAPLAEEDVVGYAAPRKRDRLNEAKLMALLARLGAEPWRESFYALEAEPCFLVRRTSVPATLTRRPVPRG